MIISKSVAQKDEEIDGLDKDGAEERTYTSDLDRILAEKEDTDGYEESRVTFQTVSTKKKRSKAISNNKNYP